MDREPLAVGARYWLKHGSQTIRATVEALESRLDLATLRPDAGATSLGFNDLGALRIAAGRPIAADPYAQNRATGSFILIDEASNHTVAAGMIDG
jgi:sulfate adenylyltransferase subunit 1 (EFTu-like GTPase family)